MEKTNTTANVILVLILVAIVAFGVWYFTMKNSAPKPASDTSSLQINLSGSKDDAPAK